MYFQTRNDAKNRTLPRKLRDKGGFFLFQYAVCSMKHTGKGKWFYRK